jgi:hypothetical protein
MDQNSWTSNVRNKDVLQRVKDERSTLPNIKRGKAKISEPTYSLDDGKLKVLLYLSKWQRLVISRF